MLDQASRRLVMQSWRESLEDAEIDAAKHSRDVGATRAGVKGLALQLRFCFEVRSLSDRLVSSSPERPCDDVRGLDPLSSEPDGDAADFLD